MKRHVEFGEKLTALIAEFGDVQPGAQAQCLATALVVIMDGAKGAPVSEREACELMEFMLGRVRRACAGRRDGAN